MRYVLDLIYLVLLIGFLPVMGLAYVFRGKKRPGLWKRFTGSGPVASDKPCVVFHAVSLGEINAIEQLVRKFAAGHPDWRIVVSTTTATGLDAARRKFSDLEVCQLPLDFSWSVGRFLARLDPRLMVLAELELWPNLIRECSVRSIRICVVNARLSDRSCARYRRLSFLFRPTLQRIEFFGCQDERCAARFRELGVAEERLTVTGNLKYDLLLRSTDHPRVQQFRELTNVLSEQVIFLAGSTQAGEENIAIQAYLQLKKEFPPLRLFLCPRHPERFDSVAGILKRQRLAFSRRSELRPGLPCQDIVLLDSVGELKYWWAVADLAFVGGSFGNRGGQNMIEPLAVGDAVCFGPNTRNFAREVDQLLACQAASQLNEPADLTNFLRNCLEEPGYRDALLSNARRFFDAHGTPDQPAWQRTLEQLDRLLDHRTLAAQSRAA